MYTRLLWILVSFFALTAHAQSDAKVKWKYEALKKSKTQYEILMTATIEKGWHLYSQNQSEDAIALPTAVRLSPNPFLTPKGKVKESGKLYDQIDAATRTRARYYADKVVFSQLIELKKNVKTSVNGEIEFMVCDDKQCLPPATVKFSVKLP